MTTFHLLETADQITWARCQVQRLDSLEETRTNIRQLARSQGAPSRGEHKRRMPIGQSRAGSSVLEDPGYGRGKSDMEIQRQERLIPTGDSGSLPEGDGALKDHPPRPKKAQVPVPLQPPLVKESGESQFSVSEWTIFPKCLPAL